MHGVGNKFVDPCLYVEVNKVGHVRCYIEVPVRKESQKDEKVVAYI